MISLSFGGVIKMQMVPVAEYLAEFSIKTLIQKAMNSSLIAIELVTSLIRM